MPPNFLPNPSRHITDNDAHGSSFFSDVTPASLDVSGDLGGAIQRLAYITDHPPLHLTNNNDLTLYTAALNSSNPLVRPGGTNIWYIDTPPDSESPMHRTVSLDFVVQLVGEIELTMSNGDCRIVKPGDIVIQRSTIHKWRNVSKTEWTRMIGIMIECEAVVTEDGKTLGSHFEAS